MNAPTANTLREAGKQARERFWADRRLQDQLDKIRAAYTAAAWDIGSAFKGALPASVTALHYAIYPQGMPPEAKAQAVGTGMQQDSDKAEIARLRAERDAVIGALESACGFISSLATHLPAGEKQEVVRKTAIYVQQQIASIKQEGKA